MAGRRTNRTKIWDFGKLLTHMWCAFDLVVFKFTLESFGALFSNGLRKRKRIHIQLIELFVHSRSHAQFFPIWKSARNLETAVHRAKISNFVPFGVERGFICNFFFQIPGFMPEYGNFETRPVSRKPLPRRAKRLISLSRKNVSMFRCYLNIGPLYSGPIGPRFLGTGTEVRSYRGPITFSFVGPSRTNVTRKSGLVEPTFLVL